jgi:hypothetical protein
MYRYRIIDMDSRRKRASLATTRVRLELHPVYATYDRVVESPDLINLKDFCRFYRATLITWLGRDRETPGAYDKWVNPLIEMGDYVVRIAKRCNFDPQITEAIDRHLNDFKDRLGSSPKKREADDQAIVMDPAMIWGDR